MLPDAQPSNDAPLLAVRDLRTHVGIVLAQVDVRQHLRYGYSDHGYCNSKYHAYYTN